MPNETVAGLLISIDGNTVRLRSELDKAAVVSEVASKKIKTSMTDARGGIMLLGEEVGVHMPRHLQRFIAGLSGVAPVMSAAFSSIAVLALMGIVVKAGEKVAELINKTEEAGRKNAEAWRTIAEPMRLTNDQLQLANDKLENAIAKMQGKPQNGLKEAIDAAIVSADTLGEKLTADIAKISEAIKKEQVGLMSRLMGTAGTSDISGRSRKLQTQLEEIQRKNDDLDKSGMGKEQIDAQRKALSDQYRAAIQADLEWTKAELGKIHIVAYPEGYTGMRLQPGGPSQSTRKDNLTDYQSSLGQLSRYNDLSLTNSQDTEQKDLLAAKIDAAKQATEAMKKAAAAQMKAFEEELSEKKQLDEVSIGDEYAFWSRKRATLKAGSENYIAIGKTLGALNQTMRRSMLAADNRYYDEMLRVQREGNAAIKKAMEEQENLTHTGDRWDAYNSAMAKSAEERALLTARLDEMKVKIDLATGAIGPHQAAILLAAVHLAQYNAQVKVLNDELAKLKLAGTYSPEGINLDPKNASAQVNVQNQIDKLGGERKVQALTDAVDKFQTTWRGMVDSVFDEVIKKSQDTGAQLKQISIHLIDSMNAELAKGMTGQKMNFRQVFLGGAQQLATSGLEKFEGMAAQALGLGSVGKQGTKGNPMWVRSADTFAAGGVAGGVGSKVGGSVSKGLLGMLNNSDWAGKLFGGKLFGSGSFFGGMAEGGMMSPGGFYLTGERGPELLQVGATSRISNSRDTSRILGGGSGGDVHHHWNIDARGTDPALSAANFQRALEQTHRQAVHDSTMITAERQRRTPH